MKRENIARIAHEINRAYCASLGDDSQAAWEETAEWQRASALAGVDMHLANPDATPEQSHAAWLEQKRADGWAYGEVKDADAKKHPCCVPYAELPVEQRAKDHLFRATVHLMKDLPDEAAQAAASAVSPTLPAVAAVPGNYIGVAYIGNREDWTDRQYGTGLYFVAGQVRMLPPVQAVKLLRHADLFERADSGAEGADDTSQILESSEQEGKRLDQARRSTLDLMDQVELMDKNALADYAMLQWQQKLDKRTSVEAMRSQVREFIDRFGVVRT